jgi:hypothetical protein
MVLELSEEKVSLAMGAILILELPIEKLVLIIILDHTLTHIDVIHVYYYFIECLVKRNIVESKYIVHFAAY